MTRRYDSRLFAVFVETRSAVTLFKFFGGLKIVSQQKMPPRFQSYHKVSLDEKRRILIFHHVPHIFDFARS